MIFHNPLEGCEGQNSYTSFFMKWITKSSDATYLMGYCKLKSKKLYLKWRFWKSSCNFWYQGATISIQSLNWIQINRMLWNEYLLCNPKLFCFFRYCSFLQQDMYSSTNPVFRFHKREDGLRQAECLLPLNFPLPEKVIKVGTVLVSLLFLLHSTVNSS